MPTNIPPAPPVARKTLAPAAFSVSARVAMQLGRESVSSSNTAIVELVKNAYDADAKKVVLRFADLGAETATLVVSDDGHGMTEDELREHWLCIGTTNKQDTRLSKQGRIQTGEKGLGRLGLDRLCERTILQTRRKLSDEEKLQMVMFEIDPEAVELDIHWDRYQVRGQRLETVAHEIYGLAHLNFDPITGREESFPHGTRLILRSLKDSWSKARLTDLADELSLMLSPFADPKDFDIEIVTGLNLPDVDGAISPTRELLDLATWKVEAEITRSTGENGEMDSVLIKVSSAQHNRSFEMPSTPWADWSSHGSKENAPPKATSHCGPAKFLFHVYIQTNEAEESSDTASAQIKSFLQANRGIRIYRDGFRVKPYGDPSGTNDWLSLSLKRARNPAAISRKSWKLAYHQVVGAVLISQAKNPQLQDQTNREGLVEGMALTDLRLFADKVVTFFEGTAHQDYEDQNPKKPKQETKKVPAEQELLERAEEVAARLTDALQNSASGDSANVDAQSILAAVRAARQEATATEVRHKEQVAELRDELSMTNVLASLGIMAAYFGHERVNDAVGTRQKMAELRRLIKDPQDSLFLNDAEKVETVDLLEAGVIRLESFARFALDTVRPWKRTEQPADLIEVIEFTINAFRDTFKKSGIKITPEKMGASWKQYKPVPVLGRRVQWECIISNLLVNSLWALRPQKADSRIINLDLSVANGFALLVFEDSGVGLEANTEADIFRTGFSTKRDHRGRQEGTGLGLSLVKSFLEEAGGTIKAQRKGTLGGARFDISVALRKGS